VVAGGSSQLSKKRQPGSGRRVRQVHQREGGSSSTSIQRNARVGQMEVAVLRAPPAAVGQAK
jgi:hypothetical protein